MSKYQHAASAIQQAIEAGQQEGLDKSDILLALLVSSVSQYRSEAGAAAVREALLYELGEVDGTVDTQFIRSR
jgi:hypothetical protein